MTTATLPWYAGAPARRYDVHDRLVSIGLVVFLMVFYFAEKLTRLPLPGRAEDLVFLALLPFGYRYIKRPKTPVFGWIVAYFAINLIPYSAAALAGEYNLGIYPVIIMKEVQYFYIAYLICQLRSRLVFHAIDSLALIIILNGVKSLLEGEVTYYGIGTFGAWEAPSLAGALFLFSSIWLHIRVKLIATLPLRMAGMLLVLAGFVCTIATVSRSSIGALVAYAFVYALLSNVGVFAGMTAMLGLAPLAIKTAALAVGAGWGYIALRVVERLSASNLEFDAADRTSKWVFYMGLFDPLDFVFGRGKGFPNALDNTFGLGVDSQYVRTIMENGILGMIVLAGLTFSILFAIRRRGGESAHAWATVAAMAVMALPLEALQVSKSGQFFWIVMFYLLMCQRRPDAPVARVAA